ncbi:MAG TPA: SulP family inorganic anion transporter [Candidatus Sulfotelmatobacter sp.]|nr:SulP family inorganic anion transporter [Candidatus Sulfotelmatobacter sp.]
MNRLARWIPAAGWLRHYSRDWLAGDLAAGVTLAAYLLPAALGDATLANLSPQAGLYACLFGGALFWLFCSSRYTAVSTTSAISLLIGATLGEIAHGDPGRFESLAAATALLVALIAFLAWLVRAGVIVNFISESVMVGFKCGVALLLASTQLPKLFGFHGGHGDFWVNAGFFLGHLADTQPIALTVGLVALAVLIVGRIYFKTQPVALLVVAGAIVAAAALHLDRRGVSLIGHVPTGLPPLGLPQVQRADLAPLLSLATACFLLGAVETAAIGRTFVAKHGGRLDANQEFLAIAAANLAAGFGRGLSVSGGSSQSLVNESSGARTPLSGALAAGVILIVVLFFSPVLRLLPQPVLAAIVLVAVAGLFQVSALIALWRSSRAEFLVAVTAFAGVLTSGLLRGVAIGSVLSIVQLLRRVSGPHVAILGRIPGTERFSDLERHPDNQAIPGVLIVRPEVSLVYFNVDGVCDRIRERLRQASPAPRLLVLDLSASPSMDLQSVHTLAGMAKELEEDGVPVRAVETHSSVRDILRHEGADALLGGVNRFKTVAEVVSEFQHQKQYPATDS